VIAVAGSVLGGLAVSASATPAGRVPAGAPAARQTPATANGVRGVTFHPSGAAGLKAAGECANWATDAGFANNGYYGGELTTAVAVALAESGCDPALCLDDTHMSVHCSQTSEPAGDELDRGAWQLNNKATPVIQDKCAYSGPCSADAAYSSVSGVGTYFALWVSYANDQYAKQLPLAQEAVNALHAGTVASTVIGSCLGYAADKAGQKALLANCHAKWSQSWRVNGETLSTVAGLCLTATSSRHAAPVDLSKCTRRNTMQEWIAEPDAELYNPGAHRCLADTTPISAGGSLPGVVIVATVCSPTQGEGWFKP
jgi:Ricin-type beta-trefoil lectin domain/Lysozyme like domain